MTEGDFAVGVDVIEAGDLVEVRGEAEVSDDLVEGFVTVGRKNRLAQPGPGGGGEHPRSAPMERTFEPAGVVTGNKLHAEPVKAVDRGIETEAAVVSAHREIEERVVARAVEARQSAPREESVHDVDGQVEVVEEGAVPIPDQVAVCGEGHGRKNTLDRHPRGAQPPAMPVKQSAEIRRWKCVCAYDGTGFTGWQSQAGAAGVQDVIEARLEDVFKAPVRIHGSGRTDSGVHARGQVFHFDAKWEHGADRLVRALRTGLPETIQICSVRVVAADFHARFQATKKRYVYHVQLGDADPFVRPFCLQVLRPLDLAAMEAAAAVLRGRHDFRAFTALNGTEREDAVRNVSRLELVRRGRRLRITAEAEGFLYKMVRSLVGALLAVGEGRLTPERVREILLSRERTALVKTAPPQGLFLEKVFYR